MVIGCRWVARSTMWAFRWLMSIWRRCRWAPRVRLFLRGFVWVVATSMIRTALRRRFGPHRMASAATAAVIMAGGGRMASWSFWAAGIPS